MPVWPADADLGRMISKLGDIDGSGRPVIAVSESGSSVRFFKATPAVPRTGTPIRLPNGTNRPSMAPQSHLDASLSNVTFIAPNPATTFVVVSWSQRYATTTIELLDLRGHDLRRWVLPAGDNVLTLDLRGMPAGRYLTRTTFDGHATTLSLGVVH
jgi:hypothetical protein